MSEPVFRTSSFCTDAHGCVEVAVDPDGVLVRDGKRPDSPVLTFRRDEWTAFLLGVRASEFDD